MLGNARCCLTIIMQVKLFVEKNMRGRYLLETASVHHSEMTIIHCLIVIQGIGVLWCYKKTHFLRTIKMGVQLCHSLISTNYHTPIFFRGCVHGPQWHCTNDVLMLCPPLRGSAFSAKRTGRCENRSIDSGVWSFLHYHGFQDVTSNLHQRWFKVTGPRLKTWRPLSFSPRIQEKIAGAI